MENNKAEKALSYFTEGFNCSQALLLAYAEQFGLDKETALKLSSVLGGGIGRMGETCGAVIGALMIIGLKYAKTVANDQLAKEKLYGIINDFVESFKSRNGTIMCRDLLGCDLSTPEGFNLAVKKRLIAYFMSQVC